MQRMMVIPYRFLGTVCRSELRKMGPLGCSETSARNRHYTVPNVPGKLRFQIDTFHCDYQNVIIQLG